jgi:hypothetical protein
LFDLNFEPQNHILYNKVKYEVLNTKYLNCSIYEYVEEKKIDEITKEVYRELGVIKNGEVLVRYQVKDLFSNAAFYREVAEIIEAKQISIENTVTVYPSLFKSNFSLSSNNIILPESITVVNVSGKDVSSYFQVTSALNDRLLVKVKRNLKKGIYFIRIVTDDYVITKKVVKS